MKQGNGKGDQASPRTKQLVKVSSGDGKEYQFYTNEEGELMAKSVRAVFTEANALKYEVEGSGAIRVCSLAGDVLEAPQDGWGDRVYQVNLPETITSAQAQQQQQPGQHAIGNIGATFLGGSCVFIRISLSNLPPDFMSAENSTAPN